MKKIITIFILFIFCLTIGFTQNIDSTSDNKPIQIYDKNKTKKKLTNLDIYRIAFWSSYGTTGLTAIINTFAHLGYSYSISQEMNSLSQQLRQINVDPGILQSLANYYPAIIFGIHFAASGLAFIPCAGGVSYGFCLLTVGICFSAINAITPNPYTIFNGISNNKYTNTLGDIFTKIYDPTPYYVVGTISVLMGVGDIITTILFLAERDKIKYPYMQKMFSISPTSFSINFYL